MFNELEMAPPDPILGLTAAFREDPNPNKINLGVGVYKNESGDTPIPDCVKKAEHRMVGIQSSKSYLPIDGSPGYAAAVQELLLGKDHPIIQEKRAVTLHAPGGTGACRLGGDFLKKILPDARLWVSDPTWSNHYNIFEAAGFEISTYPYYDAEAKCLDFDKLIAAIAEIPKGDVILLHGCCHNPTGMDPTAEQWEKIAQTVAAQGIVPFVDFAYQGLADGVDRDAAGYRILCGACPEVVVAGSFSKNFGLYCERVGSLTATAATEEDARKALSHLKGIARANYSNPPSHGGTIVETVLGDPELRAEWETEVQTIRDRIKEMRTLFVETLKAKGVERDFSFITRQNGMFSFSGLTRDQVETLRREHSIYIVGSGRINVAGMTPDNMDCLCEAIAGVL